MTSPARRASGFRFLSGAADSAVTSMRPMVTSTGGSIEVLEICTCLRPTVAPDANEGGAVTDERAICRRVSAPEEVPRSAPYGEQTQARHDLH